MRRSPYPSRTLAGLLAFSCLLLAPSAAAAKGDVFKLTDPRGDDCGDGTLVYPLRDDLKPGDLDLLSFSAHVTKYGTEFEAVFARPIAYPARQTIDAVGTSLGDVARFGFYTFNIDIYIDMDHVAGSGSMSSLPGRKVTIASASAWEKAIILTPRPYEAEEIFKQSLAKTAKDELKARKPRVDKEDVELLKKEIAAQVARSVYFPTRVRVSGSTVRFEVPDDFLGESAKDTWGYVVTVSGADMRQKFNIPVINKAQIGGPGVMILPILPGRSQEAFGGAREDDALQPPLVDIIVPAGMKQEDILKDYDLVQQRPVALPGVVPAAEKAAGSGAAPKR